ncbi:MAG: hypothetical protein DRJ38_04495 [Thermoprotei archaeon]|nr:MAG: hypothetical protein DRJ38_04495 [Thermoprotei archaeon]
MVRRVRGEEAWRYDSLCAYCRGVIGASQPVYIVGEHVLHEECMRKLLSKSPEEFEEVLKQLPLDTHEELRELYKGVQELPPRGTGLERGTARQGEERGRGKPLTEVERALRHREVHGESNQLEKPSQSARPRGEWRRRWEELFRRSLEARTQAERERLIAEFLDLINEERKYIEKVEWSPEKARRKIEELGDEGLEDLASEAIMRALTEINIYHGFRIREPRETFDDLAKMLAFLDAYMSHLSRVGAREGLLKPGTTFYAYPSSIGDYFEPFDMEVAVDVAVRTGEIRGLEAGKALFNISYWKARRGWGWEDWVRRGSGLLSLAEEPAYVAVATDPNNRGERGSNRLETQSEPEERVLTREERRKLWGLARGVVDEALREAGHRHPSEMRVDGLSPDYGKFLLALRERILKLVKEPSRVELRVETYGKGYGDTHVLIDGEYLYTWRPQFEGIVSSFWGWVRRIYNLLKELGERGLLKEEVLRG